MAKKLKKDLSENGKVKITVEGGTEGEMIFDFAALPDGTKEQLGPFGLGHKLGDSAAGKSGPDAEAVIKQTFQGLMEGKWTVRLPAAPKISTKAISEKFATLSGKDKRMAADLLRSLGIAIPGISEEAPAAA